MKFNKALVAMILAVVMVMGLCTAAMAEDEPLKIGVIGPFTGAAAIYGNACKYGAEVAVAEINAIGSVQIELLEEDDEHDAEKSLNAYNTVLDKGAQMIAGTTTTTPCIAVGAQAYEDRVFMLTPSASSPDVTDGKDNVFQVCFTDPAQGTASAQYISEHQLATKVAIIYNNADAYSTGIYNTFVAEAANQGLEIVSETTFTDDTTDFSVQVAAAKDAGADLVFLPIYYTPASLILATAKSMDYAPVFFGVDGMDGILTMEGFDASLAEGVFMLTPFSADAEDERTQSFVASYKELTGEVPNQFAADCYDAVWALWNASLSAGIDGSTSPEDACEMLIGQFTGDFEVIGLTGTMTWDETGAVTKTPTAVVIKDGAYVGFND
ncbi:MAG: ABC transporter substrate-binding protein [Clostridia bacterium]|nr:ABC transporter substrate-binding protein [Clostridia bacterium]